MSQSTTDLPRPLRILLVEDEEAHAELVARSFEDSTRSVTLRVVPSIALAKAAIAADRPHLVLADLRLPDGDGLELLSKDQDVLGYPVVIMTSHGDEQVAVDTMKTGALDYVVKSEESFAQMPLIAERALRGWRHMVGRRSAEQKLRESEEHFRSLIENALDLISVLGEDGLFHYLSPASNRVLGSDPEALVGTSLLSHVQDEDRPKVRTFLDAVFVDAGPHSLVFRVKARDGGSRVLEAIGSARPGTAGPRMAVVNCRDISERTRAESDARRLEGELRQAQKLETLGTLAGGIAHDFNNILQAILGCAELALASNPGQPIQGYLDRLLEASQRARSLVQKILAFGRRSDAARRPLLMTPVLQEAVKLLEATLPRSIEIRSEAKGDMTVLADPTQILQVVMNLCTNAQHAMEERGGILELKLERVQEAEGIRLGRGPYLRLRVSDTGNGMTQEVKERIFEPFFTTKDVGKGSGLGLSVVHGIVTSHGGAMHVESHPGKGTTVDVFLPESEAPEAGPTDQEEAINLEGCRVLYVDDEPLVAATVKSLLESRGARVVSRGSPREALVAVDRENGGVCDLAILDHTMPQMSGVELARELRRSRPTLPVVIVSGYGEAIDPSRLRVLGSFSYLPKPFGTADLLRAVGEALKAGSPTT